MQKKLNRNSDTTISTQLYEILRQNILENKWKENDKFFSVRQISIKYEVNPNTVLKVIQTLEEEGYLYSIKGKGCFVKKGYKLDINKRMTPILNTFRFGQNPRGMEINFSNGAPPPYLNIKKLSMKSYLMKMKVKILWVTKTSKDLKVLEQFLLII